MKRFAQHLFVMILTSLSLSQANAQEHTQTLTQAQTGEDFTIVMVGDSLTAGFNLADEDALPSQLEAVLRERGYVTISVINAGVSGDTTAEGLRRFAFSTGGGADAILLALGGNDALNGQATEEMRANLEAMISMAREQDQPVMLVGLIPPLNLGEDYRSDFLSVYPELADRHDLPLHPDLMGEVALDEARLMADGIHPTSDGIRDMAERLADTVEAAWLTGPES